jgi:hypothetical protein
VDVVLVVVTLAWPLTLDSSSMETAEDELAGEGVACALISGAIQNITI